MKCVIRKMFRFLLYEKNDYVNFNFRNYISITTINIILTLRFNAT